MPNISKSMVQIAICSSPDNGLAEMLSGYLQHYGHTMVAVTLFPGSRQMPESARSILVEDGIHDYTGNPVQPAEKFDFAVELNAYTTPETRSASIRRYINIDIPAASDKETLRAFREDVKKLAIHLLGEIKSSHK